MKRILITIFFIMFFISCNGVNKTVELDDEQTNDIEPDNEIEDIEPVDDVELDDEQTNDIEPDNEIEDIDSVDDIEPEMKLNKLIMEMYLIIFMMIQML